jgi:hypothetical protein
MILMVSVMLMLMRRWPLVCQVCVFHELSQPTARRVKEVEAIRSSDDPARELGIEWSADGHTALNDAIRQCSKPLQGKAKVRADGRHEHDGGDHGDADDDYDDRGTRSGSGSSPTRTTPPPRSPRSPSRMPRSTTW